MRAADPPGCRFQAVSLSKSWTVESGLFIMDRRAADADRSRAAWVTWSHGVVRSTSADGGRRANTALKLTRPSWPVVGVRARKLVGRSSESRDGQLISVR
jgi:hypothetical protein